MLPPAIQPNCCNASRNAATFARASATPSDAFMRTPMCRIRSPCCARAASGHATAPPTSVMNSRRLMVAPRGQNHARHRLTAVRVLERGEGDGSCDQLFWAGNVGSGSHDPVKTGKAQNQANVFRFAPESGPTSRILELFPPPALREGRPRAKLSLEANGRKG